MSLLEWGGEDSEKLREGLADLDETDVVKTVISYEEQMRGWMAYLARAKNIPQQVDGYEKLRRQLQNYCQIPLLDFDNAAANHFRDLQSTRIRVANMDLKIASIALAHKATLLYFNGDGVNDGQDFIEWNANKFTSSDTLLVPEPTSIFPLLLTLFALRLTTAASTSVSISKTG